jgi:hypothetical protein
MKMLLGDFNAIVCREDIFKPTIGNESLYEISNDDGVRIVNFATSENPTVKSMFPHCIKVKLSPCLTNEALHEGVWGSGCIDSHCLDLGTS